jgi:SsrA-binding protein
MIIHNKNFRRDYEEIESIEAGISLLGAEVKQIKAGNMKLEDAYVQNLNDGMHLINADIPRYQYTFPEGYNPTRSRMLLLHKREILSLVTKKKRGGNYTIVPKSVYLKGNKIKIKVVLVRGRKDIEKKIIEKRDEISMNQKKEAKRYMMKEI